MKNVRVASDVADAIRTIPKSAGRAVQTEDILRRIVGEWDLSKAGALDGAVIEEAREHLGMAPFPTTDAAVDAAKPKSWTHPFVTGLTSDAPCAFCGKTAAEHLATPETLDELQARAPLQAVGYDDKGIEHAVSDPVGALAEVDRKLASRFACRDILRAYARYQAHRGSP